MAQLTGTTADAVTALDAVLDAAARAAAALDALLPRLDDEQRREAVARVGEIGRATGALQVRIADDLAKHHDGLPKEERFTVACGYKDPLDMLTGEFGIARRGARRLVQTAALTRPSMSLTGGFVPARFPVIGRALDDGAISIDAASTVIEALGDAADRANPEHLIAAEEALVASATGERGIHPAEAGVADRAMPPELLARLARAWRDALDPDGVEPRYEQQLAQRSFSFRTRADGSFTGSFVCTPDQGAVLTTAFDAFTRPTKPRFRDDDERADEARETDERTRPQKMIDALIAMVAASVEGRDVPRVGGEAPTVVITVPQATLKAAAEGVPGCTATVERTGDAVPAHIAASMLCDGFIQHAVTGADGLPLQLGRRDRLFSRAQRRALAIRDGGCRAPGCTFPVGWTEAHHITPWEEGGPTDLDNGILVCSHHHHEVHRGALEVIWASGGWVVVPKVRAPRRRRGFADTLDPTRLHLQPSG